MACSHCHNHCRPHGGHPRRFAALLYYKEELTSLVVLVAAAALGRFIPAALQVALYVAALLPPGLPVVRDAFTEWRRGAFFNEFTLMLLAAAGAFAIREYPEGVAILLFYSFGEKLEHTAASRSRRRIKELLGRLPSRIRVEGRGAVEPEHVRPGEVVVAAPGERVGLDGILLGDEAAAFDTSAFTGESLPVDFVPGADVPSGAIPLDREVRIRVSRPYAESSMSRILALVESAAAGKSKSETLLRRITRWYTPAVIAAATLLFVVPWLAALVGGRAFDASLWLERALVLLVCSCPCALVVSIPLSYFAAIGMASARGILFKSAASLDAMRSCDTLFLDKTGTLTTGTFRVESVVAAPGRTSAEVLALAAAADSRSAHPLARAISAEAAGLALPEVSGVRTVAHGMSAILDGRPLLVGSRALLARNGLVVAPARTSATEVCVALGGDYVGAIYLSDTLKPGVGEAVAALRRTGMRSVRILSGDRPEAVEAVASAVGADAFSAGLRPDDKHEAVRGAVGRGKRVVFVGDGINDAPSLAAATVGIAIGTGGTDLAMESADAVLTAPGLAPLVSAVRISRRVRAVVAFNVSLAIGVKFLVMVLGAVGAATLWAAVFADTGITLITVAATMMALNMGKKH